MGWVRLDDGFFGHRKVLELSKDARLLFLAALAHCSAQMTDGFISTAAGRAVAGQQGIALPKVSRELVEVGLWHKLADGFTVHDYLEYQPTAASEKARRAQSKTRRDFHSDPALVALVRNRDGDHCRYCGEEVNWKDRRGPLGATYDHVDPLGGNAPGNVVVSCRGCNSSKGPRTPAEAGMVLRQPARPGTGSRSDLDQNPDPAQLKPSHPNPNPSKELPSPSDLHPPPSGRPETETTNSLKATTIGDRMWEIAQRRGSRGDYHRVARWALCYLDAALVDEVAGTCADLDIPPRSAAYFAATIHDRGTQRGVTFPGFESEPVSPVAEPRRSR